MMRDDQMSVDNLEVFSSMTGRDILYTALLLEQGKSEDEIVDRVGLHDVSYVRSVNYVFRRVVSRMKKLSVEKYSQE